MIITYHGKQCFKLQVGDTVLAYNPPSKDSRHKAVRFGADIALVSMWHPDFNGVDYTSYGAKNPFVVSGPGEYETKGIFVKGFLSKSEYEKKETLNTIYTVFMDNMRICFLGTPRIEDLDAKIKEAISESDILFISVGGDMLSPAEAQRLSSKLGARIVIPMDYDTQSLKLFLKEAGCEHIKAIEKLTVKKKDIEWKEGEIVLLEVQ